MQSVKTGVIVSDRTWVWMWQRLLIVPLCVTYLLSTLLHPYEMISLYRDMIYNNKPITSGIELCRAMAPTALSMDHATEADGMEPTRALQLPRWE